MNVIFNIVKIALYYFQIILDYYRLFPSDFSKNANSYKLISSFFIGVILSKSIIYIFYEAIKLYKGIPEFQIIKWIYSRSLKITFIFIILYFLIYSIPLYIQFLINSLQTVLALLFGLYFGFEYHRENTENIDLEKLAIILFFIISSLILLISIVSGNIIIVLVVLYYMYMLYKKIKEKLTVIEIEFNKNIFEIIFLIGMLYIVYPYLDKSIEKEIYDSSSRERYLSILFNGLLLYQIIDIVQVERSKKTSILYISILVLSTVSRNLIR